MSYVKVAITSILGLCASFPIFSAEPATSSGEWRAYAGNPQSTKYSALKQITPGNVDKLRIAWRWKSPDIDILKLHPEIHTWKFEGTPLMIDGVLYISTSLNQVAAIEASTGKTIWIYDPHVYRTGTPVNFGFVHRGVAYWNGSGGPRVFIGTGDGYLIALDARTGKVAKGFGDTGRVDLTHGLPRAPQRALYGVNSPPAICNDTVIVGSTVIDYPKEKIMPRGDVRGFDARTGAMKWIFHSIPLPGEFGSETWPDGAWKQIGAANVWPPMSVDGAHGYVYLPVSSPSSDYYGGRRAGANLFGDSLVCLDANTGKRIWHFQLVHHDLWDRDPPAAPILTDIRSHGRVVSAVAQVTKQGYVFVFDRLTGRPLWTIDEHPAPQSKVLGERTSATQPVPSVPLPFDRQGIGIDDLIDFTPALNKRAREILGRFDYGQLFFPPTEKSTILLPGVRGGASWAGAAYDTETNVLYVPSITSPTAVRLVGQWVQWPTPSFETLQTSSIEGPDGLLITKPPYGRITAIDLADGRQLWTAPMGNGPRKHPALRALKLGRIGWPYRGFPLVTAALLFVAQEGTIMNDHANKSGNSIEAEFADLEPCIQVFNKQSGQLVTEIPLPSNASGGLMTYLDRGKQFIAVPVGGGGITAELIAFSLPGR